MSETAPEGRLRLTIVGGFLGSGKTTWLRHQLFSGRLAGAHVIVNEAAGTPVDHGLLAMADGQTVLAGGCACCEGAAAFQAALLEICDARSRPDCDTPQVRQLVLETSGLADPAAIVDLIQNHPVLIRHILLHEIIVVADALNGETALRTQPVAQAQVRAADRLILTKCDTATDTDVARLRRLLVTFAPGAAQTGASFGSDYALADMAEAFGVSLPEPDLNVAPIVTAQLDLGPEPDWTALTLWLSALLHVHGDQIVRVKGVVSAPAGRLLIQAVRNRVMAPEVLPLLEGPEPTDNTLVLIGSDLSSKDFTKSFRRVLQAG